MGTECSQGAGAPAPDSLTPPSTARGTHDTHGAQFTAPDHATFLKAKVWMAFNRVMAVYLTNLENVSDEHDEAMGKLMDVLPAEYRAHVHLADHFGESRFDGIRSQVLKVGNDAARELCEQVDALRISPDKQSL